VTTKSERHRDRYQAAGVPRDRIAVVGELKFDLPLHEDQVAAAGPARAALMQACGERPVWMIASSIEGEEAALLSTIERMKREMDKPPLVIWAPRSPQRFTAIEKILQQRGFLVGRRTQVFDGFTATNPAPIDVLVGDTIGEMDFYYSMADIVFVGATLYPMGGHNPIEPLALERPVVTGPSIYGVAFPAFEAIDKGALLSIADEHDLGGALVKYFSDHKLLAQFQSRARGFNEEHHGASERTIAVLAPMLGPVPDPRT